MIGQLFVRALGAMGLLALALLLVGLDPFLGAADVGSVGPGIAVNREHKGDRLPMTHPTVVPDWQGDFGWWPNIEPRAQIPFACDAAVSTIIVPAAVNIYRRCMT